MSFTVFRKQFSFTNDTILLAVLISTCLYCGYTVVYTVYKITVGEYESLEKKLERLERSSKVWKELKVN